jgi:hypothetical protein
VEQPIRALVSTSAVCERGGEATDGDGEDEYAAAKQMELLRSEVSELRKVLGMVTLRVDETLQVVRDAIDRVAPSGIHRISVVSKARATTSTCRTSPHPPLLSPSTTTAKTMQSCEEEHLERGWEKRGRFLVKLEVHNC